MEGVEEVKDEGAPMDHTQAHRTKDGGGVSVSVSAFDDSAAEFLAKMEEISALSGEETTFPEGELQRFSSMITFVTEWRHFRYESKTVNFAYQTGCPEVKEVIQGINLPQFSSAAVPKMEQLPDETNLDSQDFVLHAGGPVWALDWCPRIPEGPNNNIKCEYLAVAAHPPGFTYHKIGEPLSGRGVIQIWCLLSIDEKVEYFPPGLKRRQLSTTGKPRGRPRKRPVEEEHQYSCDSVDRLYVPGTSARPKKLRNVATKDLNDAHGISLAKPGRPRKKAFLGLNGSARPRGRPRKQPLPGLTNLSGKEESAAPSNNPIPSVNERFLPLCVDLAEVALPLPAAADLNGNQESFVPRRRGRPRKKPNSIVNDRSPTFGLESGKGATALLTSEGVYISNENCSSADLKEVALALPASVDLNGKEEPLIPTPRGSPSKKPIPNVNDSDSGIELWKDSSVLLTSRGENLDQHDLSVHLEEVPLALISSADLNIKEEQYVLKHRGRPKKKPIANVNNCAPVSGVELVEDASAQLPVLSGIENLSLNSSSINLEEVRLALPSPGCLSGKDESSVSRRRGRPRKNHCITASSVVLPAPGVELGKDASVLPTSRGENLGQHNFSVDLEEVPRALLASSGLNAKEEPIVLKRRGRLRKKPIPNVNCDPASGVELGEDASSQLPSSRGLDNLSLNVSSIILKEVPIVLPPPAGLSGKDETNTVALEEVPRALLVSADFKNKEELPAPAGLSGKDETNTVALEEVPRALLVCADFKNKEEPVVLKRRGRPRKKPTPNVNNCDPALGVELGEDASAHPSTSRGLANMSLNASSINLEEVPLVLPAPAELSSKDDSLVPKHRGRLRKKPARYSNDYITSSDVESREDVLAVPNSKGLENSSVNGLNVDLEEFAPSTSAAADFNRNEFAPSTSAAADFNRNEDFSLPRHRGRQRKNQIPAVNEFLPASSVELGEDTSAVPSHDKQLEVTVEPTYDIHYQDKMVLCKEVMHSRSSNTNTSRSIIPKVIAIPRVVLCLAHDGSVAWDAKWRAPDVITSEGKCHMGYLAVLLGNGFLEVWEVPLPSMVKHLYASCSRKGSDPRFLKLKPVFRCSKVKCGDRQSIPLTVEWSPSGRRDLILAGCHDGTVAMWKFSAHYSSQDTKPLLCFIADSVPIRALAWAPEESDVESANLVVTAGHNGLKFWDIRDPFRPLWDFNPVQRVILSLDWLRDPRCVILAFDDGTLRTISLWNVANDVPITGKPFTGTKQTGLHVSPCSSFAIWSVQMSRATGLVAYCNADGSAVRFQLTANAVKDPSRHRQPHFLCSSIVEEGQTLNISTPLPNNPLSGIPFSMKKSLNDYGDAPRTIVLGSGDSQTPPVKRTKKLQPDSQTPPVRKTKKLKTDASPISGQALLLGEADQRTPRSSKNQDGDQERKIEVFPNKIVAMHRVRWNMNKGSERWLCYGGAAGIIRCQAIGSPTMS